MENTSFTGHEEPHQSFVHPAHDAPVAAPVKKAAAAPKPYEKPVKAKCELTGEEVRGLYGVLKSLHEQTGNNINAPRGDLGPLKRELGKIKWYDCTEWKPNGGPCTYAGCEGGLH
jgi:hypothetical protein